MTDVKVELQEIKEESDSAAVAPAAAASSPRRAAGAWRAWRCCWSRPPRRPGSGVPWTPLPPPRVVPLTALRAGRRATFSPDGEQVAFYWNGEKPDNYDIYVKLIGSSEVRRLTTDPAVDWGPDLVTGRAAIAFVRASPRGSTGPSISSRRSAARTGS